jgi:hypothetical protein
MPKTINTSAISNRNRAQRLEQGILECPISPNLTNLLSPALFEELAQS